MRRYHHIGIPTRDARAGEVFLENYQVYASGFEQSPYGVEWLRYGEGCGLPDIVRRIAHVAFEVDDLEAELEGQEILIAPNSPSEGVTVAFILHDGAPVELLRFDSPDDPRGSRARYGEGGVR